MNPGRGAGLSPDHPWPGLASFDEADHDYFRGRELESAELLQRVRRTTLTVLFGRSGLGKTSLLRAGLFPMLRALDFLPVPLRLDFSADAPAPRQQLWRALQDACQAHRVQAPAPAPGDAPWTHFQRRSTEFWSELNRPLTPVLVLDPFEELFTLGRQDAATTAASAAFLADLADLVENRPPAAVRERLERDPSVAPQYEFRRATVHVVLSFREDFLAEVEELKAVMPSLMGNRLRLLPMDGRQAYTVVTGPGGALVDDQVARRILRLAWRNEPEPPVAVEDFGRIEIDPALLSVVCTELNHKRLHAQPPLARITATLLAGADREILAGFYERATGGFDPRVRAFIEDELITDRGYRDSHDWEDALLLPGVAAPTLESLVAGRLLRLEERQGRRRIELAHDVLTRVVMASRDRRRAQEAEADLRRREEAAARQQRRNRRNGALVLVGVFVLLVLGVVSSWEAWRAREAKTAADAAQAAARDADAASRRLLAEAQVARGAARDESVRADAMAGQAREQEQKARILAARIRSSRLLAGADRLPAGRPDAALLLDIEALRRSAGLDAQGALLARLLERGRSLVYLDAPSDLRRRVLAVAFRPDGQLMATAGYDHVVTLWNPGSGRVVRRLVGHSDAITSLAFSPDGRRLLSGSLDRTLRMWDVERGETVAQFGDGSTEIWAVAFSPDGRLLASGGGGKADEPGDDFTIRLWNAADGREVGRLQGHKDMLQGVAFSPDGRYLVSAGLDGHLLRWEVATRQSAGEFEDASDGNPSQGAIFAIAFSPDGRRLAVGREGGRVELWNAVSLSRSRAWKGHEDDVYGIAFSPDGQRLATAAKDGFAIVWDVAPAAPLTWNDRTPGRIPVGLRGLAVNDLSTRILAKLGGHVTAAIAVAFNPGGTGLVSASGDGGIFLWNLEDRRPLRILGMAASGPHEQALSPDGGQVASVEGDGSIVLLELASGRVRATLAGPGPQVRCLAFSPDGRWLATGGEGPIPAVATLHVEERPRGPGLVVLWDVARSAPVAKLEAGINGFSSLAFRPDGRQLVAVDEAGRVYLWDLPGGRPPRRLDDDAFDEATQVAYAPDGRRLAIGRHSGAVDLLDPGRLVRWKTLGAGKTPVTGLVFEPDGRRLAAAHFDGSIELWDLAEASFPDRLTDHKKAVRTLAFSADGQRLASGDDDGVVLLWEVEERNAPTALAGLATGGPRGAGDRVQFAARRPWNDAAAVDMVAFGAGGRELFAGASDGSLAAWVLSPGELVDLACHTAHRNLSRREWRQWVSAEEPYRKTCERFPVPDPEAESEAGRQQR